jgi:hypothetical protein
LNDAQPQVEAGGYWIAQSSRAMTEGDDRMRIEGEKQNTGRRGDAVEPNAAAAGSTRMTHRDILAIGTSAGGFGALRFLAGEAESVRL